ncbi:hypothetical protein ACWGI8_00450 [Streptomyces sp. NPDC054841]
MESPAENKRSAVLALAVLGVLLVGALVLFTVFDGEDDTDAVSGGKPAAGATQDSGDSGDSGDGGGTKDSGNAPGAAATPIVPLDDVEAAHRVMAGYMAGLNTYEHTDKDASWASPLLALTTRDEALKQETTLPSGKEWDACLAARCASEGKAVVVRDAMIADDLTRGSGKTISSVVKVTATRSEDGRATGTETNSWLVSVQKSGSEWKVSAFDLYGLGNVGASDETGE